MPWLALPAMLDFGFAVTMEKIERYGEHRMASMYKKRDLVVEITEIGRGATVPLARWSRRWEGVAERSSLAAA